MVSDALNCIQRTDGTMPAGTTTKATHQAAYLRSFRVPYPKAAVAAKVSQIAAELGITLSRLVMPTRDTLAHYEVLLEAITSLVEMKKVADRVDQDIRTAKMRLGIRDSEAPVEMPMDVDEDGQVPETPGEGRAHSVVSTRSGRSRKQASVETRLCLVPFGAYCHLPQMGTTDRRSMSVSSVDTSATSTTRAGTKRQKLG
jgi:DNA methyltransferase 1-associated protein 1